MTSEPRGVLARWLQLAEECRAWAAANPEIATAWDEALEQDEEHERVARLKRNEIEMAAGAESALVGMGVPIKYARGVAAEVTADEPKRRYWNTRAMEAARCFVASKESLLVLFGGTGVGKSCAAAWVLLRARRRKGYDDDQWELAPDRGAFAVAARALSLPRFNDGGEWDRLLSVRWLVLDELGIESSGDYAMGRLNELLNLRYANELRTVITCNLGKDEFKQRVGDRIVSRIRDDGLVVGCGDEDLRGGE